MQTAAKITQIVIALLVIFLVSVLCDCVRGLLLWTSLPASHQGRRADQEVWCSFYFCWGLFRLNPEERKLKVVKSSCHVCLLPSECSASFCVTARCVWSQVNADVVNLVRLSNGELLKLSESTTSVGRFISTKAVGSDERRDITHQYKYAEGTADTAHSQSGTHVTSEHMHTSSHCC